MGAVTVVETSTLPPLFEGKPHSEWQYASGSAVRRMRGFWKKFFWGLIDPIATIGFLLLFWPVGILALLFCIYRWQKILSILSESLSKKVKSAPCPTCARPVNFWVMTGFPCPHCHRTLIQNGPSLYDIT